MPEGRLLLPLLPPPSLLLLLVLCGVFVPSITAIAILFCTTRACPLSLWH
jgi:hypothetical protein